LLTKQIESEARAGGAGVTDRVWAVAGAIAIAAKLSVIDTTPNSNAARPRDNEWRFI